MVIVLEKENGLKFFNVKINYGFIFLSFFFNVRLSNFVLNILYYEIFIGDIMICVRD